MIVLVCGDPALFHYCFIPCFIMLLVQPASMGVLCRESTISSRPKASRMNLTPYYPGLSTRDESLDCGSLCCGTSCVGIPTIVARDYSERVVSSASLFHRSVCGQRINSTPVVNQPIGNSGESNRIPYPGCLFRSTLEPKLWEAIPNHPLIQSRMSTPALATIKPFQFGFLYCLELSHSLLHYLHFGFCCSYIVFLVACFNTGCLESGYWTAMPP